MPPPPPTREPRGWHSRGYLPHFDTGEEVTQSVTFRLIDSVPVELIGQWRQEFRGKLDAAVRSQLVTRIEQALDGGQGACHLSHPAVAEVVEGALLFFGGTRYHLHAWVVMPNHVHALFTPRPGHGLSDILGSWKSYTAKEANRLLRRTGPFWQADYFDRYVRSDTHFADAVRYIENNPVAAGLCARPEDWLFGSARRRVREG